MRRAVLAMTVLSIAGICLVCVALPLLRSGREQALPNIPPYGGAKWDTATTYHTMASQREVLNYYKVQFAEHGFATMALCPGAGERVEDYSDPHPRIIYGKRSDFAVEWDPLSDAAPPIGPELGPGGVVRRTYLNPIGWDQGACGGTTGKPTGHINAQFDVEELNPFSDVWLDYSVEYRPGQGADGTNLVVVHVDRSSQPSWGN